MSTEADYEPSTEPEWERTGVTPAVAFEVLSDSHRRTALRCLLDQDGSMAVEDLAWAVVATGGDGAGDATAHHQRVKIALHHTHLPKLSDAGVIEYHRATGVVAPLAMIDDLAPLLEQYVQQ